MSSTPAQIIVMLNVQSGAGMVCAGGGEARDCVGTVAISTAHCGRHCWQCFFVATETHHEQSLSAVRATPCVAAVRRGHWHCWHAGTTGPGSALATWRSPAGPWGSVSRALGERFFPCWCWHQQISMSKLLSRGGRRRERCRLSAGPCDMLMSASLPRTSAGMQLCGR